LEALSVEQLQDELTDAIESVIDRDALNEELKAEKEYAAYLAGLRKAAQKMLADFTQ